MSLLGSISNIIHPNAAAPQASSVLGQEAAAPASAAAAGAPMPDATAAGAAQAQQGADAVQPPQPTKIIFSSVLRGAMTGVSMMFGLNFFGPKIPFVNNFISKTVLPWVTKIPFLAKLTFPMGTLATIGAGAIVGGIFGLLGGLKAARKATAEYTAKQQEAAQAAAAANPVGDPLVVGQDGNVVPIDPASNLPAHVKRNKVMKKGYKGVRGASAKAAGSTVKHHIVWGDTLWALSRRYGCSINDIVKANPGKITNPNMIYAGDTIRIPKKKQAA